MKWEMYKYKTLLHVASRSIRKVLCEWEKFYEIRTRVDEIIILAPEVFAENHRGLSLVPLLEMEAQSLKYVEKAESVSRSC
jgi:hypothetical protein